MSKNKQQGSIEVIIIVGLVVVVVGLAGMLFWQNFVDKPTGESDKQVAATTSTSPAPKPSVATVDPVAEAKSGISKAMNTENFDGLADYMAVSVDGALSHSDGIFNNQTAAGMTEKLRQHFVDYAQWNNQPRVSEWTFANFEEIDHTLLKQQAAQTTFFDFTGSYVGIGKGMKEDAFVAFQLNDQGKITYVFYGTILGY